MNLGVKKEDRNNIYVKICILNAKMQVIACFLWDSTITNAWFHILFLFSIAEWLSKLKGHNEFGYSSWA